MIVSDPDITVGEIESLFRVFDKDKRFQSRYYWRKQFNEHFNKLINLGQVITFRDRGRLTGFCTWVLTDEDRKNDINKSRWTLPENVSEGDILYIDNAVIDERDNIFQVKKYFSENYKHTVKKVFWFNSGRGRVFKKGVIS